MTTLALDLAKALDPTVLAAEVSFDADPWQEKVLRSRARRMLILASRRSGKSTVAAHLAVHEALFHPGSTVLLISASMRQAMELLRVVKYVARQAGRAEVGNATELHLENGSRVISLSSEPATARGYTPNLIVVDEGAQVSDDMWNTLSPMVSMGRARIIVMSTPFGKRGWMWAQWSEGGPDWERFEVPATMVPRIDPQELEAQRRTLGELKFQQEFMLRWLEPEGSMFMAAWVDESIDSAVQTLEQLERQMATIGG